LNVLYFNKIVSIFITDPHLVILAQLTFILLIVGDGLRLLSDHSFTDSDVSYAA